MRHLAQLALAVCLTITTGSVAEAGPRGHLGRQARTHRTATHRPKSDDLLNQMLAQVHALGLLNLNLKEDFGLFDTADFKLTLPPMISASTGDGSLRLVLGDMIATFSDNGKTVVAAALNASVDLEVLPGDNAEQIGLQFGKIDVFVNVIDGDDAVEELFGARAPGSRSSSTR